MQKFSKRKKFFSKALRAEENNRQLELFVSKIEQEIDYLSNKLSFMEVKLDDLKELNENVIIKQVQLEERIKENFSLLASESSNKVAQMKVLIESIVASTKVFICDQFYQKSLDYTLSGNMSHLNLTSNESSNNTLIKSFNQFKSKFKAERIRVGLGVSVFDSDQRSLLGKLLDDHEVRGDRSVFKRINELLSNIKYKFNEIKLESDECNEIEEINSELMVSLHNCQQFDKNVLLKYVGQMSEKFKQFSEFQKEYEAVIEIHLPLNSKYHINVHLL